jgi:hypothetical protein
MLIYGIRHKHHPKAGVIAGSVIGSLAIVVLAAIGIWYLRFRRPKSEHAGEWVGGGLPKTGAFHGLPVHFLRSINLHSRTGRHTRESDGGQGLHVCQVVGFSQSP